MYPINPQSVARDRERHSTSGAKSDLLTELGRRDVLAEIVLLDSEHHRPRTSPITRAHRLDASRGGPVRRNRLLGDAVQQLAFYPLLGSPGARAYTLSSCDAR